MAYYGMQPPVRQASWEQQAPPSRSGASSAPVTDEPLAFHAQFEEVDRTIENLVKSGKLSSTLGGNRRDSMPAVGAPGGRGPYDFDPRMGGGPRHHSVSDIYVGGPRDPGNVQGFYANQRYGGGRGEGDQTAQTKRRMAAQRERELRNYHQEQQYNRSILAEMPPGAKSERPHSPSTSMNEDERRELIARQHRALYGEQSNIYSGDNPGSRPLSQDARVAAAPIGGVRGQSPLAFDPYGLQTSGPNDNSAVQMPSRDQGQKDGGNRSRDDSNSSPASNPTNSYALFDNAQQSSRTSNSSPTGGSPPRQGSKPGAAAGGVAPIGTRPAGSQLSNVGQPLSKRSTTPLPSPLSYAYTANNDSQGGMNERTTSASSNPNSGVTDKGVGLGWGSNSGVWGNSGGKLGVQASVWG